MTDEDLSDVYNRVMGFMPDVGGRRLQLMRAVVDATLAEQERLSRKLPGDIPDDVGYVRTPWGLMKE